MAQPSVADALAQMQAEAEAQDNTVTLDGNMSVTDAISAMTAEAGAALQPQATEAAPETELTAEQKALTPGYYVANGEPGLGEVGPGAVAEAALGGAVQAGFETRDFLFGEPEDGDRSALRASVEDRTRHLRDRSIVDGVAVNIGQFAMGMFGVGKVAMAAKALPWFGRAASSVGTATAEIAKAATVGAVAFDPHEERLSNIIQNTALANPLTAFLAADPEDTNAEGRLKAALESIGLDYAIIGTLAAGAKVYRALRRGDAEGAARATSDGEDEIRRAMNPEPETPVAPTQGTGTPDNPIVLDEVVVEADPKLRFRQDIADLLSDDGSRMPTPEQQAVLDALPADLKSDAGEFLTMGRGREETNDLLPDDMLGAVNSDLDARRTELQPRVDELYAKVDELYDGQQSVRSAPRVAPDIEVSVTSTPTAAAAGEGVNLQGTPTPLPTPRVQVSEATADDLLRGMEADAEAISRHGSWQAALDAGHTFGRGSGIPYRKMAGAAPDMDDFVARVADASEERLNAIKGGDILSDARVSTMLNQRAALFNEDPAAVFGMIQQAGQMAPRMVADMEAGYLIASRMLQDSYTLAQRIRIGDYSEFGNKETAMAALRERLSLATSSYGAARSITANAGRAVRRMRSEFAVSAEDMAKLNGMDDAQLVQLLDATQGNPRNIAKLANPSLWRQGMDALQFLYVNNLVSGWQTQLVNVVGNAYMVGARPLERILGASLGAARGDVVSQGIVAESTRQYLYLGTSLRSGWSQAVQAFKLNDSVMSPHQTEVFEAGRGGGQALGNGLPFKPMTSVQNILHNVLLSALPKALGVPTRSLGFLDELTKQTVYRSKLMARAHVEATGLGAEAGLKGSDLQDYVRTYVSNRMDRAFDDMGRALDPDALREAQIATFQQELLPNTWGKSIQTVASNHPSARFILPFIKTPTNILRYAWKMTPVLNLAQTEYRQMLSGAMGAEAKAQAVGQVGMGTLFLGTASFMAANGSITGGGPRDYKLRQELMATGWKPYSFVRQNPDGTRTYVPFNRLDPVAISFGMVADMVDAMTALGEEVDEQSLMENVGDGLGALTIGIGRQFVDKAYFQGVAQFLENVDRFMSGESITLHQTMAANFIPFAAMMRQTNTDPYLREARTVVDRVMATVPGLSDKVPARYDAFGDPILARRGLWSSDNDELVDNEMQRLALQNGKAILRVSPTPANGVDLRDITLADGTNAYERYQQLSGHLPRTIPAKEIARRLFSSSAYQKAPDGDASTPGTRTYLLARALSRYRQGAMGTLMKDPAVRDAILKRRMDAAGAYRSGGNTEAVGRSSAPDIGSAFGVDLGGLFEAPTP